MKCPCCGAAELIHDTRDLPYLYKGETTTIPAVTGDFCPACGEVILNREHGDRYSHRHRDPHGDSNCDAELYTDANQYIYRHGDGDQHADLHP